MKRVRKFTCWTDYPFVQLGDVPFQQAPIRRVKILAYDFDKYVAVEPFGHPGQVFFVKTGYLYSQPGRYGHVRCVNRRKIERFIPDKDE